jgi:hypothetical protein
LFVETVDERSSSPVNVRSVAQKARRFKSNARFDAPSLLLTHLASLNHPAAANHGHVLTFRFPVAAAARQRPPKVGQMETAFVITCAGLWPDLSKKGQDWQDTPPKGTDAVSLASFETVFHGVDR